MIKIFEFLEINTTETIIKTLEEQSEKQKKFKSSHNYSLEEFGFKKDIFSDF